MNWRFHTKSMKTLFCMILFAIFCTMTIWAGTWELQEDGGCKYKQDEGTYLSNVWIQENGKWYFLDENGLQVANGTVEGYQLGADGAEISGATSISSQYTQVIIPVTENEAENTTTVTYVLNKNTKKFHKPGCSSVSDIATKNRVDSGSSRDEVIAQGYVACKRCKP